MVVHVTAVEPLVVVTIIAGTSSGARTRFVDEICDLYVQSGSRNFGVWNHSSFQGGPMHGLWSVLGLAVLSTACSGGEEVATALQHVGGRW